MPPALESFLSNRPVADYVLNAHSSAYIIVSVVIPVAWTFSLVDE